MLCDMALAQPSRLPWGRVMTEEELDGNPHCEAQIDLNESQKNQLQVCVCGKVLLFKMIMKGCQACCSLWQVRCR